MRYLPSSLVALILASAAAVPASAQSASPASAKAAAAVVSADPGTTSATYGDWVLRCVRSGPADKKVKVCEVSQTLQLKGQTAPIAQIAFGKVTPTDPLKLTVVLPSSIALPSTVKLSVGDADPQAQTLAWRRCLPTGCYAEILPSADVLKSYRAATAPGRLAFRNAADRDIAIPFSFVGLPQALDALAKG